jgi:hypothetical protein
VRSRLVLLLVAAVAGCGGDGSTGSTTTTRVTTGQVTTTFPSLGCDVAAQCFPQLAQETLARCPASRLDAHGRRVRRRLEKLLARIAAVDLHNEEAYVAANAVIAARAELERICR